MIGTDLMVYHDDDDDDDDDDEICCVTSDYTEKHRLRTL
jgi:hypothetical protein